MSEINQFKKYTNNNFEFSEFQIKSCLSILKNKHVLITAHTGSGKTLPAEFSIFYNIVLKKKKVIYTAPIKALSNQKYKEFSEKFPNIEIGILTGDIKHNPGADLLIMTTEILQNNCFKTKNKGLYLDFNIDMETQLGSVIFDEVHYIDDPDRGTVWEQTMIMLPNHIPYVMLSATIGEKELFSDWISNTTNKEVVICSSEHRIVPLTFYEFFTIQDKYVQNIKDKNKKNLFISKTSTNLNIIKTPNSYNYKHLGITKKCKNELSKDNCRVFDKFVLNECLKMVKEKEMFPCLLFVFSRKKVENIAKQIFVDLFLSYEKDYLIKPIFKKILINKIVNWREYIDLPECYWYIDLLEKGIGIHHAGMLPVFREIMEILYEQKYIKVLIATETFAIGLNMPTRTVIFNSLYKHDGNQMRLLKGHEFIQMAGRAGRRNIDTKGHVILLTNNYDCLTETEYYDLFHSKPKILKSKFRITYNVMLNYLQDFTKHDFVKMIERSLMNIDIQTMISNCQKKLEGLNKKKDIYSFNEHIIEFFENYEKLKEKHKLSFNKEKRKISREISTLEANKYFTKYDEYISFKQLKTEISHLESDLNYANTFIENQINILFEILQSNNYIDSNYKINPIGISASYIHELPCLVFCDFYSKFDKLENYTESQIVTILTSFYEIKMKDDYKIHYPNVMKDEFQFIQTRLDYYKDFELSNYLYITCKYSIQYDLIEYIDNWYCNINNIDECKVFFHNISNELDIFIGDFIKCCMKIVNMCNELIIFCQNENNYLLLEKIKRIQTNLQKNIVSNNSLYV